MFVGVKAVFVGFKAVHGHVLVELNFSPSLRSSINKEVCFPLVFSFFLLSLHCL